MSIDLDFARTTEYEQYEFPVFLLGTGAAAPTILGRNIVTMSRNSTGNYTITFPDDPGPAFLGGLDGWTDTSGTLTTSAGYSVVFADYVAPSATGASATLTFQVTNGSYAATDIATTQKVALRLTFRRLDPSANS